MKAIPMTQGLQWWSHTHHAWLCADQLRAAVICSYRYLISYPGYIQEPRWLSKELPEISRVTLTDLIQHSQLIIKSLWIQWKHNMINIFFFFYWWGFHSLCRSHDTKYQFMECCQQLSSRCQMILWFNLITFVHPYIIKIEPYSHQLITKWT